MVNPSPGMRSPSPQTSAVGSVPNASRGSNLCPITRLSESPWTGLSPIHAIPRRPSIRGTSRPSPKGSPSRAALTEPFSCCYNGSRACQIEPGDSVLIIGAGPSALCTSSGLLEWSNKVIISEMIEERLTKALELGADLVSTRRGRTFRLPLEKPPTVGGSTSSSWLLPRLRPRSKRWSWQHPRAASTSSVASPRDENS